MKFRRWLFRSREIDKPARRGELIALRRQSHLRAHRIGEDAGQQIDRIEIEPLDAHIARRRGRKTARIARRIDAQRLAAYRDAERVLGLRHRIVARTVLRRCGQRRRSEEQTYELQSLMRIAYAVFCLKKKQLPDDTLVI